MTLTNEDIDDLLLTLDGIIQEFGDPLHPVIGIPMEHSGAMNEMRGAIRAAIAQWGLDDE
jgi:hypothetical protein